MIRKTLLLLFILTISLTSIASDITESDRPKTHNILGRVIDENTH